MVELLWLGPLHIQTAVSGAGQVSDQGPVQYLNFKLYFSVHFPFGAASPNIIMGLGMFELSQVEFSAC